jgi:WhiB family redox-sensing transcriptional regulator
VIELLPRPGWHARAACRNMSLDIFFAERGGTGQEAKKVCRGCEVRQQCLNFALTNRQGHGIWGGTSVRERERLRRQMRRAS